MIQWYCNKRGEQLTYPTRQRRILFLRHYLQVDWFKTHQKREEILAISFSVTREKKKLIYRIRGCIFVQLSDTLEESFPSVVRIVIQPESRRDLKIGRLSRPDARSSGELTASMGKLAGSS
jgi:hypothetical protein